MNFRNLFWILITILVLSFTADAELSCSFIVDLDPPVIEHATIYPAPGSNITESYICSSFDVYDSLAGVNTSLLFAALTIYNDRLGTIDTLTLLTEDGFCRNYQNCDSVVVCVRARDLIPETDCGCLANFLEYCWWFTVKFCEEGPAITSTYPDPYGVIVSCADQYATFNVVDTNLNCDGTYYTILEDSFEVDIRVNNNGLILDTTIVGTSWDGITWTPITSTVLVDPTSVRGDWNDGDTVTIVLREAINDGGCDMFYSDSVQFIIDLTPPYVASVSPDCMSTIYSSNLNFNYTLDDSISGVNPSTDIVTVTVRNADGIWHTDSTLHTSMYELTGLSDGDTVEFCIVGASDSPDLTFCPANVMDDYCCEYYISMAEPYAWIINPVDLNFDGWTISSCPCQEIEMGIYDRNGIDTDTIVFFVEDDTMSLSDPRLTFTEIDDTVFITYTPEGPSPCWNSCEHVHFGLLFATDILHSGFLDTPVIDSFYVDLEPPVYSDFIPAEGETLNTTMVEVSALSADSCTYEICDSAYFDIIVNDTDSTRAMGGLSTSQGPFEDGDEIRVCVSGCHDNPDYCEPNMTRNCNTFYISLGEPYGWIIQPLDENGDGDTISHCNCQSIIVGVFDSHGIDTMSIELEVEGLVYSLDDPQLSLYFDGDTVQIEFTPSSPCWSHNQIVNYELITANNSLGQPLVEPVIGSFLIDLEGPLYSGLTPLPSSVLSTTTLEISAEYYDSICGEEGSVFDSMQIWINDSLFSYHDTIFYELADLENNDSVHVCVYAHDNCQDYCTVNNSDTCWNFRISLGTIAATLLEPIDITGDGRVISNCECQPIIWRITHTDPINESSIEIEVDGESITIDDPRLLYYATSDSLVFTPSPCWDETDSIDFALVNIEDETGSSLGSAMTGYVIIDLDPPYIYDWNPLSDIIYTDSVTVQLWYTDSICSTVVFDSMAVHINSDSVIISYTDSLFLDGLSDGDSVSVFSWIHDECSDYCAPNDSMYYWHFTVELGEPYAWIVEPVDLNDDGQVISTCECQPIILRVYDEYGIDETTVEMVVLGTTYDYDSPEITVSTVGDSTEITFTPTSPCWLYDEYVEYTLTEASNTLGEPLTSEITGNFTIDLSPPEYTGEYPGDGSSISTPDVTIEIDIEDAVCIDAVLDSISVSFDGSHYESFIGYATPELTGLSEGSYEVCCYSHDDCFDYCGPNYGNYCWNFNVSFTCSIEVDAGPDQISCPGVEFEIGCDPTAWHGTPPYTYEWTSSYPSDDPDDIANPTVSPAYTTTYYLTVTDSLGCTESDSIVIDIPYEPLGTFDLIYPSFDTVAIGEVEFCWTMPSGSDPYFDFILDDETLVRALTDTCYRVEFPCGEYHTWAVVAYNYCHYDMDFWPCRSDSLVGTINDSSVVGGDPPFWTEPCPGPVVAFEEPIDLNGDGDTISACECQRIVWSYISSLELDFDELVVNVNGTEYTYFDDEIDIVADSIIFTPSIGDCWSDDDIVYAYVSFLDDTAGVPIEDSAYGAFLVDLDPPVFSGPSPLGIIYEDSAFISLIAESDVCAEANYDSMIVTSSISEMIWRFYDGFDQAITGLEDNDSVHICAYASETCHDYCTPLISSNCWDFLVDLPCDMTVEARVDSFICYGSTAELEAIISGGTSPFTYLWFPDTLVENPDGQSTETINLFESTEFTLFAFDTNGCTDSVHFMVNVGEEIDIELIPSQTLCVGVEFNPLCNVIGTSGEYTSIWVSSESETLTIDDPTITILDTIDRTWEVQVVDEYGCEGRASVDISVPNTVIGSVSLVTPTCLDTISSGLNSIEWTPVDNADFYALLVNTVLVEDSIPYGTETHDFDFECGNEYVIEIIAYRSCYYELFDCDSTVIASGFTAPESSSAACSIFTENCGVMDAYFTLPMPAIISACSDQNILMEIIDNMGYDINPSSIDFSVNGTHYTIDDSELSFADNILSFSPNVDFFTDGDVVAILHDAANEMGIHLDDSVVLEFSIDITPPEALFVDPGNEESIYETSPVLEFELDDNLSGIDPNSAELTVNGITYSGLVLDWFDDVMSFDCNTNGIEFAEGDSIPIVLDICDSPTPPESLYCSPNCATFEWFFRIIQDFDCDAVPIPFTPLEMSNNYVQFEYPGLSTEEASIKIFNARNILIREIDVSPGSGARNYARWDGNDNNGNMQRPGLYLYVVVVDDEIICNGTIVLAR